MKNKKASDIHPLKIFTIFLLFIVIATLLYWFVIYPLYLKNNQTISPVYQPPLTPADSLLLIPRKIIFDDYLNSAQHIADTTGNQQAKTIVNYLKTYGVISVLTGSTSKPLERKNGKVLPIIVIMKSDSLTPQLRELIQTGARAFFDYSTSSIKIKETNEYSSLFRGLLLLHEGKHAMDFYNSPYNAQNERLRVNDEYNTYSFVNELLLSLGGKLYKNLLDETVLKLQSQRNIPDFPESAVLDVLQAPYNKELDVIFGKAENMEEEQIRQTWFAIHACFEFYDSEYPDKQTADTKKHVLIDFIYQPLFYPKNKE